MKKRLTLIKVTLHIPAFLIAPLVWPLLLYRRIRYGYPFRRIPLTRGKYAIVDPEDYCSLIEYKWYPCRSGGTFYARRGRRRDDDSSDFSTQMHRHIIKAPPGMVIDHINHNGLDNRKANLRIATQRQNSRNCRKLKKASSKYKGVCWHKQFKKWHARIVVNRRQISLGCFNNEIHAAKTYDNAAKKYHGEFASLNFPLPR